MGSKAISSIPLFLFQFLSGTPALTSLHGGLKTEDEISPFPHKMLLVIVFIIANDDLFSGILFCLEHPSLNILRTKNVCKEEKLSAVQRRESLPSCWSFLPN